MKILEEKTIHDGFLKIVEGQVEDNGKQFTRLKIVRPSVVAAILYNEDTEMFLLAQQYRYPIGSYNLEVVAGYIDEGETPMEAMKREILEETGYKIESIEELCYFHTSPGVSNELIYGFIGVVKNSDRVSTGGGLASENESIVLRELTRAELITAITSNMLKDAKTVILAQRMLLNKITSFIKL